MERDPMEYANLSNLTAIEQLYETYRKDPSQVESSWRHFFEGMEFGSKTPTSASTERASPDLRVYLLIDAYRKYGHLMAQFNPISTKIPEEPIQLKLSTLSFKDEELEMSFPTCGFIQKAQAPLKEIIEALKKTYCGKIGIEYMGLGNPELERWIQQQIEPLFPLHQEPQEKVSILHNLNKAELFEVFLHTKYVGQKRFSIEGAETMIPMLSAMIELCGELSVQEVVIGMAHRGRLNVLANIMNKSYAHIFHEFEDFYQPGEFEGTGDVKYHKGFVGECNKVIVTLAANPSHLESVDPVMEGIARAKQEKSDQSRVIPILIHGDAALAGQGVVYETLQLCKLRGYTTGGTVHLVVNNQIGFTTVPQDARSTLYCTDIARTFGAPVFHLNAEDPEGCVRAAKLAIEIRNQFKCDVFLDVNCYRKYGHNESDEPTFTQPLEYDLIKKKRTIRELFKEQLIKEHVLDEAKAKQLEEAFKKSLQEALESPPKNISTATKKTEASATSHSLSTDQLIALADKFCTVPEDLRIHPKIAKLTQDRAAMVHADPTKPTIDWGMGEYLAYATLLTEKIHVRISGQDVRRGTFSHRHAMWVDQVKERHYFPLSHLSDTQAPFTIFNSCLSEFAVLGFDFGYSTAYPNSLVIWEAQFGDFVNGAQVIIDQYIASCEQKWNLHSNLTLLLPHGYEGQGPEHSSGRMERFLQLSGHENMRVANCSTPAQIFHLLRSQAHNSKLKPLIIFTPKALLRHPACLSSLNDFVNGAFMEVIKDPLMSSSLKRAFFCSGKIYYDLIAEREKRGIKDIAIMRVEQLYPFPKEKIQEILTSIQSKEGVFWIQEEHSNMGAWEYVRPHFDELLGAKGAIQYIGRDRSASVATGSHAQHKKQLQEIMQLSLGGDKS